MRILILMAGKGQRFIDAGYKIPKPFIRVAGRLIIEHIVKNFSNDDFFVFGCNEEQLSKFNAFEILNSIVPQHSIVSMPYKKEGPIYGLKMMNEYIPDNEPVIVNYCDFSWGWDYDDFKKIVKESNCDGAVVCYRGFHPHLLGQNSYATLDSDGIWMKEIKEKHSWHNTKFEDWSSSGTYYFKKGSYLKKYIYELDKKPELKINNEHYVSQLYQLMKEDGFKILIYEIPYMLQWGTPEDLAHYLYWSNYFNETNQSINDITMEMDIIIPMAGEGMRFKQAGYLTPKPLISINGLPMVVNATKCLPRGHRYIFITRTEHLSNYNIDKILSNHINNVEVITSDTLTEGQACSVLLAKSKIRVDFPLFIGACDNGMTFDLEKFKSLISNPNIEALIFTFRGNPTVEINPSMYSWVLCDNSGRVLSVKMKQPISKNPINDHAVVGAFWFKKGKYFIENSEEMIKENSRVNGEFYIDNTINYLVKNDYKVYVFEIDKYICWGTVNDLKIYEYWEKYFRLKN